jgi:prepilin-type N-terminal cleavage/methylation domain-containing protein
MNTKKFSKGFTLIELLIVITIIGILAVALLPSVLGAPARARDAARKADLSHIIAALETFNSDHQHYPDGGGCIDAITDSAVSGTGVLNTYFQGQKPPSDPQTKSASSAVCSAGNYVYCPIDVAGYSYMIGTYMEVPADANVKGSTALATACTTALTAVPAIADPKPADADAWIVIK